jgi:hypothetical protein
MKGYLSVLMIAAASAPAFAQGSLPSDAPAPMAPVRTAIEAPAAPTAAPASSAPTTATATTADAPPTLNVGTETPQALTVPEPQSSAQPAPQAAPKADERARTAVETQGAPADAK